MNIALFYNLPAGGAKRALYEHARHLRQRGHRIDGYVVSTASENFLPLGDVCDNVFTYEMPPVSNRLFERLSDPRMERVWRRLGAHRRELALDYARVRRMHHEMDALETLYAGMARDITARGHELAYVHQCITTQSPPLLRHLPDARIPTVYYCQDTLRYIYEWSPDEIPGYDALPEGRYMRNRLGVQFPLHTLRLFARKERQYIASTRAATVVLANSWYSREAILRTTGVSARVCYLGVDADFFCPDPSSPHADRENVVLSVGMLMAHKRHDFVLDAIATIPPARRPRMRIIGYEMEFGNTTLGPVAKRLLCAAEEKGVELILTKDVSDEVLRDAYRRASVVAFAPYLEPFGFVPLEAMACGTPVVGVREGGVRETIEDGVTGFLTDRDPAEFGAALDRILRDGALREELGRNGRRAATERWTWERSVDTLERCFAQAAGAVAESAGGDAA